MGYNARVKREFMPFIEWNQTTNLWKLFFKTKKFAYSWFMFVGTVLFQWSITVGINYKLSALFQGQRVFVFFITANWWFLSKIQIEHALLYYSSSRKKMTEIERSRCWVQCTCAFTAFLCCFRLGIVTWNLFYSCTCNFLYTDSLLSVLECLLNSSDVHVCGLLLLLRIADIFFCVLTLLTA